MDTIFVHKGVECHFSPAVNALLETDECKADFVDNFFKHEPINSIKWVTIKELEEARVIDRNAALPMYSIQNDEGDTLLIWPMLNNADLFLYIESLVDRPDMVNELNLG